MPAAVIVDGDPREYVAAGIGRVGPASVIDIEFASRAAKNVSATMSSGGTDPAESSNVTKSNFFGRLDRRFPRDAARPGRWGTTSVPVYGARVPEICRPNR